MSREPAPPGFFGSHARGTASAESDIDVIVVAPTERPFVERFRDYLPAIAGASRRCRPSGLHAGRVRLDASGGVPVPRRRARGRQADPCGTPERKLTAGAGRPPMISSSHGSLSVSASTRRPASSHSSRQKKPSSRSLTDSVNGRCSGTRWSRSSRGTRTARPT